MSDEPKDKDDGELLEIGRITITRVLSDGEDTIAYRLSDGLTIIEVLGMLSLAELQIVEALYDGAYTSTDDEEDDDGDR